MKYYLIAGEHSSDMHGAALMRALAEADGDAHFRGIGGKAMRDAGLSCFYETERLGMVGILELLRSIFKILRLHRRTRADILAYRPDIMIFIDFAGFNLSIAAFTHKRGFYNSYYISPKVWVWRSHRVHRIKRVIHCMLCIFPMELSFYRRYDYEVFYVGNPLPGMLRDYRHRSSGGGGEALVALLPGSRLQEVKRILPVYADLCKQLPGLRFRVAALSSVPMAAYAPIRGLANVELVVDDTYALLVQADAAAVASGTASLETAIIGTPHVVCYRMMPLTIWLLRLLTRVRWASLTNLILERQLIEELLGYDFTVVRLTKALQRLLYDKNVRDRVREGYAQLREKLGAENTDVPAAAASRLLLQYKVHHTTQSAHRS